MAMEKTEKATPRRRQEAREKGQVARSGDVAPAMIILGVFALLGIMGSFLMEVVTGLFHRDLTEYFHWQVTDRSVQLILTEMLWEMAKILLPLFGLVLFLGVAGNLLQVGVLFTTQPLKMDVNRLNPVEGMKRIFSLRALVEFVKSLLKFIVITVAVGWVIWLEREELILLAQWPLIGTLKYVGAMVVKTGLTAGVLLLVLAVFDYFYQRYDHEKKLRMSKQEVKDELKRTEGDPLIRSRIKERQRALAMRRMMQEVPHADVVITNPTHYAVALKYDMDKMPSPQVVAKGKGHVALRIREIAQEHNVVIVENPPLARLLYSSTEVGDWIPPEMFQAVAEVLAYVYQVTGRTI